MTYKIINPDYKISPDLLLKLSIFVSSSIGLNFPKEKFNDLERGIKLAFNEFNFENFNEFIDWLISSSLNNKQVEILAAYLTIGETFFYRDEKYFDVLENNILSDIISSRRDKGKRIRIWSAGCSSGEEPYSIAILLNKMIPDIKDWDITILASDVNPKFLKKANEGIYTEWSFRNTPAWIKNNYFVRQSDNRFIIRPSIKKMVNLSYLNLAADNYPSLLNNTNAMDLIFCRNVLMYFIPDLAAKVILNLHNSLIDGGLLFVSPAEASLVPKDKFILINFDDAILFKKYNAKGTYADEVNLYDIRFESKDELTGSNFLFDSLQNEELIINEELSNNSNVNSFDEKKIKDCNVLYLHAYELYKSGFYEEAEKKLLDIFTEDQFNTNIHALLSQIYANKGELNKALTWCEKAITNDKLNPAHYYLKSTILQELGNKKDAIRLLKQSLYLDHNFVMAYFSLGNLVSNYNQPGESKKYFQIALSILNNYAPEDILPYSDGMSARKLSEIISASFY
ncbi:MAG: chemotaxis protein CheR [Bacteroidetes bacterium]|nr:chemotaxis protein CheR [Bacteroidota bacterium]